MTTLAESRAQEEFQYSNDIEKFLDAFRDGEQREYGILGLVVQPDPQSENIDQLIKEILGS